MILDTARASFDIPFARLTAKFMPNKARVWERKEENKQNEIDGG